MKRCGWSGKEFAGDRANNYELYAQFGPSLGNNPVESDSEINALTVAIVPMAGAEFYHFGTTRQMVESLSGLQNRSTGRIEQDDFLRKPHPDMYVLNSSFAFKNARPITACCG